MDEELRKRLEKVLMDILKVDGDSLIQLENTRLTELGLNSISFIRLIVALEDEFLMEFEDDMFGVDTNMTLSDMKEKLLMVIGEKI